MTDTNIMTLDENKPLVTSDVTSSQQLTRLHSVPAQNLSQTQGFLGIPNKGVAIRGKRQNTLPASFRQGLKPREWSVRAKLTSVAPDEKEEEERNRDFGDLPNLIMQVLKLEKRLIIQSGATLCWRNICYQREDEMVLAPTSGLLQRGEMICILAGPNSGSREMLDILSGRSKTAEHSQIYSRGEILLNRLPPGPFYKRTVALVPKTDNHLAHLTVRETLEFSARMRSPVHSTEQEIMDHVDLVLRWLGMEEVQNTIVGNATVKGISGGQKRRLSIGVELVSGFSCLVADLPTNGLDAKTAFDVVDRMRRVCATGKSAIMALASPSPELLMLFDKVIVLAKGETLYYGGVPEMKTYFEEQGFINKKNESLPVWIEDLIQKPKDYANPQLAAGATHRSLWADMARYYKTSKEAMDLHMELVKEMTCDVFDFDGEAIPQRSALARLINRNKPSKQILHHGSQSSAHPEPLLGIEENQDGQELGQELERRMSVMESFDYRGEAIQLPGHSWSLPALPGWFDQVKVLMKRRYTNCKRNKVLLWSRLFQVVIMGVCLGLLFFQLDNETVWNRLSVIAFSLEFLGFGAVPFIPDTIANERPTFYHQKSSNYFKTSAWYFANWLVELPQSAVEVLIFTCITYPLVGLTPDDGGPFIFYLMAFLLRFTAWGLCQVCCAIFPSGAVGAVGATTIIPILFSFAGFLIPISHVGGETNTFSQIMNYLSFFSYPFQGLVAFEMDTVTKHTGDGHWHYLNRTSTVPGLELPSIIYWGNGGNLSVSDPDYDDKEFITDFRLNEVVTAPWIHLFYGFMTLVIWNIVFNFAASMLYDRINWAEAKPQRRGKLALRSKWPEDKRKYAPPTVLEVDNGNGGYELYDSPRDNSKIQGIYVEFSNLNYHVTTASGLELHLLKNVNGYVRPGDCIALMGPSGAGKSTLLDVLAGKKNTGVITGQIKYNGKQGMPFYFSRIAGYVEQFNSHMENLKVREALEFAAELRMDAKTPNAIRQKAIDETLAMLELDHLGDELIGTPSKGISLEAMKKLTIAVELIGNPGLLFLDEPTTGLDSAAAINVMNIVRKLADRGQSVICTIHQPPAAAYKKFSHMLLLQVGGTVAYYGETKDLNEFYVEAGCGEMKPGKNPADWAIEAIARYDSADFWSKHRKRAELIEDLSNTVCPDDFEGPSYPSAYATSTWKQFTTVLKRSHRFFWRDHHNIYARFFSALAMGIFIGIGLKDIWNMHPDFKTVTFLSVFYCTVVYCSESAAEEVPIIVNERATFYREIDSKFFSAFPYYLARWMAQQPLLLAQGFVVAMPLFWLTIGNFPAFGEEHGYHAVDTVPAGTRFLDFLVFFAQVYLALSVSATFSQAWASASPNEGVGNVLYFTMCCLSRLFSGFIIFIQNMGGAPKNAGDFPVIRLFGRFFNMLDFFKYCFFTFGDFFINGTGLGLPVEHPQANRVWRMIANPYPSAVGEDTWMPHSWLSPSEYSPKDQTGLQRYQFLMGLLIMIAGFNIVTFLLLSCKRWDKR